MKHPNYEEKMDLEQSVRRKLTSIVNRLEGGRKIDRHPDSFYYSLYAYGHEVALVLTAIGLSHPLVQVLRTSEKSAAKASEAPSGLIDSIAQYPAWLASMTLVLIAFWIFTRVTVNQRKLGDKVPLYKACSRELGRVESDLDAALSSPTPLGDLTDLQVRVKDIVDKYYAADGWPWPISPPDPKNEIGTRIESLCVRYKDNWDAQSSTVQQRA